MSDQTDRNEVTEDKPNRNYKWRYGPLRLVLPWVAVAVGAIVALMHIGGLDKSGRENTSVMFFAGVGLALLGVIAFLVYRWMARRGM